MTSVDTEKAKTRKTRAGGKKGLNRRFFTETEWVTVEQMLSAGVPWDKVAALLNIANDRFQDAFWNLIEKYKQAHGKKKPLLFSDEKREFVRLAIMAGRTPGQVAEYFGLAEETVRLHFAHEWRTSTADMLVRVAGALYRKAMGDGPGSVEAAKFILARRGGQAWAEKGQLDVNISARVGADVDLASIGDAELETLRQAAARVVTETKTDDEAAPVPRITVEESKPASDTGVGNEPSEVGLIQRNGAAPHTDPGEQPDAAAARD